MNIELSEGRLDLNFSPKKRLHSSLIAGNDTRGLKEREASSFVLPGSLKVVIPGTGNSLRVNMLIVFSRAEVT